jgi:predicted nucleic acid-binding protein
MRLYLDTSPVIYTVEQVPSYAAAVDNTLSVPGTVLIASELTRMECRVKPLRDGNADLLRDYDEFFHNAVAELIPLTREVMDCATEIRAQYGFKTPDAIHLAAAVVSGCGTFFTNDHRLDRFSRIAIEIVQP